MNNLDRNYKELLANILSFGSQKRDRTGTGTVSIFGKQISHDMSEGFPLLTTKKMAWKQIVVELLWFLRGDTNIKYLIDNDCHIWDGDAYMNYIKRTNFVSQNDHTTRALISKSEFIEKIKTDEAFCSKWGDLGPIYGLQWRRWRGLNYDYDQISNLIKELKKNPDSRRLMVSAWKVDELDKMVLPPCHYGFQVYTRELDTSERSDIFTKKYGQTEAWLRYGDHDSFYNDNDIPTRAISLMWNQRSVDTFLGLPFNIASYGLLLSLIAKATNMIPEKLVGSLGDVHLYNNHIDQAKEQIFRVGYTLPNLELDFEFEFNESNEILWHKISHHDVKIVDYRSEGKISAPLSN